MQVVAELVYERENQIGVGQGRNSQVFLANDLQLGGKMVVKEIPKAAFGAAAEWFQEAQTMFACQRQNVVTVRYACQTATHICLAMPHYPGGSLADRTTQGPLPVRDAIRIFLAALSGLAEIHVQGFLHFDVKPSNILFDAKGHPHIADFGQSRPLPPGGAAAAPPMYVPGMAPEIVGPPHAGTVETDIYQAGLSLYRAVNGDPWFDSQRPPLGPPIFEAIRNGRFPDRHKFYPHVPRGLRTVIRKALRLNPQDRFHSARGFIDALGQVDCPHNWVVADRADGGTEWRSDRPGKASFVVRKLPTAVAGRWAVEIYSGKAALRRYRRSTLWVTGLTGIQARDHLKRIFDGLH